MEYSSRRGSEIPGVAMEHHLYKDLRDINVCGEFNIFKVKV